MSRTPAFQLTALFAGSLVAFLLAGELAAQDETGRGERKSRRQGGAGMPSASRLFEHFDTNGDGKLTKDELPDRARDKVMRADTNGDGVVTKEELESARKQGQPGAGRGETGGPGASRRPNAAHVFQRFDANGDGKLTKDELPEGAREKTMRADTNGDGVVTKKELEELFNRMQGPRDEPGKAGPGGGTQFFERLDRNRDGKITTDEMPEKIRDKLMRADTNGDGAVSKKELDEARKGRPGGPGRQGGGPPDR